MTTYTYDTTLPKPTSTQWSLLSNARVFASPLTGATQSVGRSGERWKIVLTWENIGNAERAQVLGFFARLNGAEHRFKYYDHGYTRRGTAGGTPRIRGASQSGNTLEIDGATSSVTNYLRAGDWLSFSSDSELKMVTADCDSNGSGQVSVPIIPKIRVAPTDNELIDIAAPVYGTFIMVNDELSWTNTPMFGDNNSTGSTVSIEAIEDIV